MLVLTDDYFFFFGFFFFSEKTMMTMLVFVFPMQHAHAVGHFFIWLMTHELVVVLSSLKSKLEK